MKPAFRLTRSFSLLSLALIVVVSVILSYAYYRNAEQELILRGDQRNQTVARLLVNAMDMQASLQSPTQAAGTTTAQAQPTLARLMAGTTLRKFKFYNTNGMVLYSSEASNATENKATHPGFKSASAGGHEAELTLRGMLSPWDGRVQSTDVLGSYLPFHDAARQVVGIVEIYDDVSPLVAAIRETRYKVFALTALLMLALYAALMVIVVRADRILGANAQKLQTQADQRAQALLLAERDRQGAQTARNEAQNQRQKAEAALADADQATHAKSQFLANMSHEMRTPMNAIIGFSDLALLEPLAPPLADYVGHIKGSAVNLLGIINDVLDLSKIDAGRVAMQMENFSPERLARDVLATVAARAAAKNLTLNAVFDPDLPRWVKGDSDRLRQVLLNLLGNAVKFTDAGFVGLTVTLAPNTAQDQPVLAFKVADSGIGIGAQDIDRIFQPFEQVTTNNAPTHGGTGLGLALAARLVQLMNGQLQVTSALGQGSEFTFNATFDAVYVSDQLVASAPMPLETSLSSGQMQAKTVLLVEDNIVNQKLAQSMLKRMGCAVLLAPDGLQGAKMAREPGIDLILMDVQMPVMDGLQSARTIRSEEAQMRRLAVPIVALTANAMESDKRACIDAGMNGFMSKPYQFADLERMVRRYLRV